MQRTWRVTTAGWMALILVGSLLPVPAGARGGLAWHLAGYSVLGALLSRGRGPGAAWTIGTGYGALIEGFQWLAGYRSAELLDVAINGVGVGIGLAAALLVDRAWGKRRAAPPA